MKIEHEIGQRLEAKERIEWDFDYHPPLDDDTELKHETIRGICKKAAGWIVDLTPISREQSIALTKLEEAMMWANAAIARERKGESNE